MRAGTGQVRLAVFALLFVLLAPALHAQQPGQGPRRAARGILVGARAGIDFFNDAPVLGAQTHFLLDPWGVIDLMPNAEARFKGGVTDWQLNADVAVMPRPGLYVGGGAAFLNTLYKIDEGRETRVGYSTFAGLRPPPAAGELNMQIELRWTFVDFVKPRMVTAGVNWPLVLWR